MHSELVASRLALGTVQFGLPYGVANTTGQISPAAAGEILRLAANSGIDTLDTAIGYGESEACLGDIGVQSFKVVTKLPRVPDRCGDVGAWVRNEVNASLGRLKVESVYGILLHRPEDLIEANGNILWSSLLAFRDTGRVKKIGVSIYAPTVLDIITRMFPIDLVQAPFNLVDRRLLTSGWLERLKKQGVEIHTRSVFLQGLLLMPRIAMPPRFAKWDMLWDRWYKWQSTYGETPVAACLAFALGCGEIDRIVVGVDSVGQLQQIMNEAVGLKCMGLPDLHSEVEELIDPSRWAQL